MPTLAAPSSLRVFKVSLGFLVLGPAFGGLPFVLLLNLADKGNFDPAVFLGTFLFAYLFGLVPAFVTGIVSAILLNRFAGGKWCWYSGLAGLLIACSFGLLFLYNPSNLVPVSGELVQALIGFGLPGLLGGALSAWVILKAGIGKPSFKES